MNIQTVRDNLKRTIAGKETYLAQWQSLELINSEERSHRATIVGMLAQNIGELSRILIDVEKCCEQATYDSWKQNPDRMGGQFTDEEINRSTEWR